MAEMGACLRPDAQRQGARIRHCVSARLGGRAVPEPARDGGERARRTRKGAASGLCRADPGTTSRLRFVRRQPPYPWPVAECHALALRRRTAVRAYRDRGRTRAAAERRSGRHVCDGWLGSSKRPADRCPDEPLGRTPAAGADRSRPGPAARRGDPPGGFKVGDHVFHQKFGYGAITSVEDNKLSPSISTTPATKRCSTPTSTARDKVLSVATTHSSARLLSYRVLTMISR